MPHPRDHLESNTAQDLLNHNKKVSLIINACFHIIAMQSLETTFSNRCDHMGTTLQRSWRLQHFTTIAEEWFLYDRNDC